jgi:hypothetical protein
MKIHDFRALRRVGLAAKPAPPAAAPHTDKHLHRNWVLIPTLIFAVLAAVAVFGDGRPERPARHAPDMGLEQLRTDRP